MAATNYPLNHPLAVKRWAKGLMKEALKATHAAQFMGTSANSLCQIKSELNKDEGDRIRFGLRAQLTGEGVQGDGTLEGNEEALTTYYDDVIIDQLRHAVRSQGKMSEQRVPFTVRDEAKDGLKDWWADRFDTWFFNQLCGADYITDTRRTGNQVAVAPDSDHLITPGGVSEGSLASTSTFTLDLIDACVEKAKTAQNPLRPIMIGNKKCYVIFLHPYQLTALRTNTDTGQWLDIQKAAMQGGKVADNPIFTGANGMYNNVIIHDNTRVPKPLADSALNERRAVFCGAQAAAMAFGKKSGATTYSWVEELFDYENQLGVAAGNIGGMKKCRFNGSDFATIAVTTYAAEAQT